MAKKKTKKSKPKKGGLLARMDVKLTDKDLEKLRMKRAKELQAKLQAIAEGKRKPGCFSDKQIMRDAVREVLAEETTDIKAPEK